MRATEAQPFRTARAFAQYAAHCEQSSSFRGGSTTGARAPREIRVRFHPADYPASRARRLHSDEPRMPVTLQHSATVLICTYNRAARLEEMLSSLAATQTSRV